jgi:hypothetical protein
MLILGEGFSYAAIMSMSVRSSPNDIFWVLRVDYVAFVTISESAQLSVLRLARFLDRECFRLAAESVFILGHRGVLHEPVPSHVNVPPQAHRDRSHENVRGHDARRPEGPSALFSALCEASFTGERQDGCRRVESRH